MAMDFSKLQDPNYLMALGQGFSQLAWSPISPNTNAPAPMQAYQKSITDQNAAAKAQNAQELAQQQAKATENKTLQWLQQNDPEAYQYAQAGLPVNDAFNYAIKKQQKAQEPQKFPAGVEEYRWFQQQTPEVQKQYSDWKAANKGGINISNEGTIPQGMRVVRDNEGRPLYYEPIPGSPADLAARAEKNKKDMRTSARETQGNLLTDDIDRALRTIDGDGWLPVTGWGDNIKNIPGTNAKALDGFLTTVKANISFDKLQAMRESSPTGAALGTVSDSDMKLLSATMGSMDQSQDPKILKYNLARLYNQTLDVIHGPGNGPPRKDLSAFGEGNQPASAPPEGIEPDVWDAMSPEDKALWQN